MEPAHQLIKCKLSSDEEQCLICVEGDLIENLLKWPIYLALIERHADHAIMIFKRTKERCVHANDLKLDVAVPVNNDFSFTIGTDFVLTISLARKKFLFELPASQHTHKFLVELKNAKDVQSQTAAFGLPPSFSWLAKYLDSGQGVEDNPFATDIFDPLKYMQLDKTEDKKNLGRNSEFSRADDRNGPSLEAPDFVEPDSLQFIQKQFNVGSGLEVPIGLKPVTARESFVRHYMVQRESEFTHTQNFRVFCGTWNVNGQSPSVPIHSWLACDNDPPDIYAVGFQELDLSKEAFIFSDSPKEVEWLNMVTKCLHPKAKYRKVKLIRLIGVMLIIFVREELHRYVCYVDTDSVPTGIMGILGNKGGVSVRMTIHHTSLCFINSHLAAHQDEFERRNQDYRDISSKIRFKQFIPNLTIGDHDVVFWIGDLNYRISDLDIKHIKDYIELKMFDKLLPFDQLQKQLGKTDIFHNFIEGVITFSPTYKYDPGTDDWDTSEKCRVPAWCDRILWKDSGVRQLFYRSHSSLKISDHKPVSALFEVGIKIVDQDKSKKVYEDIMKKLDRIENEYLPQVKLDKTEFFFENVKFIEPQMKSLVVANIGQGPVEFEFINKLNDNSFCKPWLKAFPFKSIIDPGALCEIHLEVYVDKTTVGMLNGREDAIKDILVLHLNGGKDFFISVDGNYIPTSFGSSIEALIQMHGPIREVPVAKLVDLEQPGSLEKVDIAATGGRLYAVPKEIWRLIDHLYKYGHNQEDLFRQPGLNVEIQRIRDCLDTGFPDKIPGSIHSVAEALLLFLESLPDAVIPYTCYQKCLDSCNNFMLCKQVLASIPEHHRTVFKYICAFLRELLKYSDKNSLDAKTLASLFAKLFLRPSSAGKPESLNENRKGTQNSEEKKRAAFVYHFLTNDYDE